MLIGSVFMYRPRQQSMDDFESPSLRDAGRQVASFGRDAGDYIANNKEMIGWAAATGVFVGLGQVIGDNLNHMEIGSKFANIVTYTGSLAGIIISSLKTREYIDKVCLERRAS